MLRCRAMKCCNFGAGAASHGLFPLETPRCLPGARGGRQFGSWRQPLWVSRRVPSPCPLRLCRGCWVPGRGPGGGSGSEGEMPG